MQRSFTYANHSLNALLAPYAKFPSNSNLRDHSRGFNLACPTPGLPEIHVDILVWTDIPLHVAHESASARGFEESHQRRGAPAVIWALAAACVAAVDHGGKCLQGYGAQAEPGPLVRLRQHSMPRAAALQPGTSRRPRRSRFWSSICSNDNNGDQDDGQA